MRLKCGKAGTECHQKNSQANEIVIKFYRIHHPHLQKLTEGSSSISLKKMKKNTKKKTKQILHLG